MFASGSLARVWSEPDIVGEASVTSLPDVAPASLTVRLGEAEYGRVRFRTLGRVDDPTQVILGQEGPRLAVFNTVQTAAVVADRLRKSGADVLHISTALCPSDRVHILAEVTRRLDPASSQNPDWTLVATSLVEAGVDLSFRSGLRERFSTASLIQLGARVNRHGHHGTAEVLDVLISADDCMITHPGAKAPATVLERLFDDGCFEAAFNPAELVTRALRLELRNEHGKTGCELAKAEDENDYPEVDKLGRLIDADTTLVVVDAELKRRLETNLEVDSRALLAGSVTMWRAKIGKYAVDLCPGRLGLHVWKHGYDPGFLGYMAGALRFLSGEAFIV